jgi:single-strand DNA-binding protein
LWGKLAELAEKYVKNGNSLIIEGEISYRSYENKEGTTIYTTEIIGNTMHFVASKKSEAIQAKDEYQGSANKEAIVNKSIEQSDDMSDLPF